MVKYHVASARDAHYEAQQRTVNLSMKPAVGKELFSSADMPTAGPTSFESHFETERFIHGKIRQYTLRSIAHANSSPMNTAFVEQLASSNVDERIDVSQGFGVLSMLMRIRSDVQLSFNNDYELSQHIDAAVFGLPSHLRKSNQVKPLVSKNLGKKPVASEGVGNGKNEANLNLGAANCEYFVDGYAKADYLKVFLWFVSIAYPIGSVHHPTSAKIQVESYLNDSCTLGVQDLTYKQFCSDQSWKDTSEVRFELSDTSRIHFDMKKESGLGTAQLRYQQSMATGPPLL